jgi:hypothetical protein
MKNKGDREMKRKCKHCGEVFITKYNKKVYCSTKCRITNKNQSRKLRAKKGTRKNEFTCKVCGSAFETTADAYGNFSRKETCSKKCFDKLRFDGMRNSEKFSESRKAVGRKLLGVEMVTRGKSFNVCVFTSPDGVDYECDNICDFVRNNRHLFDEDDIKYKSNNRGGTESWCRAQVGLVSLSSGNASTWKGWTIRSKNGYEFGSATNLDDYFGR